MPYKTVKYPNSKVVHYALVERPVCDFHAKPGAEQVAGPVTCKRCLTYAAKYPFRESSQEKIEQLEAEVKRLRAALELFSDQESYAWRPGAGLFWRPTDEYRPWEFAQAVLDGEK